MNVHCYYKNNKKYDFIPKEKNNATYRGVEKQGFTLIELLVTIAIIGLLSAVVLASLSSARSKARDSKRISQMKQLTNALEFYYNDNGHFPYSNNCGATQMNTSWCNSVQSLNSTGRWIRDGATQDVLAPYISEDPVDPTPGIPGATGREPGVYYYFSNSSASYTGMFMLVFTLENVTPGINNPSIKDCLGNTINYGGNTDKTITWGVGCQR